MHHGFAPSASEELLGGGHFAPLKVVETWFLVQRVSDLISFLRSRAVHGNEPFYLFFGDLLSRETDSFEVGFDTTSASFEIDVQAQLTMSLASKIEGHVTESLIKKCLATELSIFDLRCEPSI